MKKAILATAVLVLFTVFSFVSCKKEGVYKPKERISKIFYEYSRESYFNGTLEDSYSSEKHLSERWHWKGKKLMQVETGDWAYNFVYKGNQLEKIEYGDIEATFTYNKSLYEKIEIKEHDQNILVITIDQRDGDDKITKFFFEMFYESTIWDGMSKKYTKGASSISNAESFLRMILPNNFTNILSKNVDKKRQKAIISEKCIVELKYDKNNLIEQVITYEDEDPETYIFTYDDKKNPYYKSIHTSIEGVDGNTFIQSENNILTMYDKEYPEDITKFEYKYDGDYPEQRIEKYSYGNEWYSTQYVEIYYYEYE